MQHACLVLRELAVPFEASVVSAHRMPDEMFRYAESAVERGLMAIIAGAGGAAHLPGMVAAKTVVPVLGVPIPATLLNGVDALMSIVQMPGGIPVGTLAIGIAGARNAGLLAVRILALENQILNQKLHHFHQQQTNTVLQDSELQLPDVVTD